MSDRKSLECHSMTMSDDEHYGVFKESEVRELETERNELLSKAEKLESRLIESKEKSDHYKGYLDEYREMWFDRELGEKNPVVIENTKLKKQLNIAVEALEGIISCVENPLTSHQDIAEYCEKVSRETINQIGE